jgi:hypothetical protein
MVKRYGQALSGQLLSSTGRAADDRSEADNATQLIPRDNARDNTVRSVQAPTVSSCSDLAGKSADEQH